MPRSWFSISLTRFVNTWTSGSAAVRRFGQQRTALILDRCQRAQELRGDRILQKRRKGEHPPIRRMLTAAERRGLRIDPRHYSREGRSLGLDLAPLGLEADQAGDL